MGVVYKAYSVIGIYFKRELLYTQTKEKAFPHNLSEDLNFCPKTGKKLWRLKEEPIPEYNNDMVGEYEIIEDNETDLVYCALFFNKDEENGYRKILILPDNIEKHKEIMKNYLEKLNLWTDNFGLHTILAIC